MLMLLPLNSNSDSSNLFVNITDVAPTIKLDIKYFTSDNFVGEAINGYLAPKCFLTKKSAYALKRVQDHVKKNGYSLLVFDCYRPQRAVNHFMRWAKDLGDLKTKTKYYPEVQKNMLFKEGYIAEKSGHSRGSTVDLTLVKLSSATNESVRYDDCRIVSNSTTSLNMGTHYDCFSVLSNTANPTISNQSMSNRLILKNAMLKFGFKNYSKEWWHYTLIDEPVKNKYFDFVIR
jgi:D-alanyl-D-alanine dipeptidase